MWRPFACTLSKLGWCTFFLALICLNLFPFSLTLYRRILLLLLCYISSLHFFFFFWMCISEQTTCKKRNWYDPKGHFEFFFLRHSHRQILERINLSILLLFSCYFFNWWFSVCLWALRKLKLLFWILEETEEKKTKEQNKQKSELKFDLKFCIFSRSVLILSKDLSPKCGRNFFNVNLRDKYKFNELWIFQTWWKTNHCVAWHGKHIQ